jgi:hypothetical protein
MNLIDKLCFIKQASIYQPASTAKRGEPRLDLLH